MRPIFIILCSAIALCSFAEEAVTFTKATDLYYAQEFSTQYNHQLWFTTEGLTYDPIHSTIEGEDGMVMRLDLMCPSATNIAGTYEIVGPKDADAPYKMNKKYTYWTYYEKGGFDDQKLTIGTCTITCTSKSTYTITYDVQEIDKGPTHKGTIKDITIIAVTSSGKDYTLVPSCTNAPAALDDQLSDSPVDHYTKIIQDGQLYIQKDQHIYNAAGNMVK